MIRQSKATQYVKDKPKQTHEYCPNCHGNDSYLFLDTKLCINCKCKMRG